MDSDDGEINSEGDVIAANSLNGENSARSKKLMARQRRTISARSATPLTSNRPKNRQTAIEQTAADNGRRVGEMRKSWKTVPREIVERHWRPLTPIERQHYLELMKNTFPLILTTVLGETRRVALQTHLSRLLHRCCFFAKYPCLFIS